MKQNENIKYFIPAQALEHPANGEQFNLHQKIVWAIVRYRQNQDFFSLVEVESSLPPIYLEKVYFNKEQLGYDVCAIMK